MAECKPPIQHERRRQSRAAEPLHDYTVTAEVSLRYRWKVRATDDTDATKQAEQSFVWPWDEACERRDVTDSHVIEVSRAD